MSPSLRAAELLPLTSTKLGISTLRQLVISLAVKGAYSDATESWSSATGATLFSFVTSGSRGWAKFYAANGPLFLRIGNLDYETIELDLSQKQHVCPPPGAEGTRTRVAPGDILVSITGDTGMVAVARPGIGEAYINQHIALARPGPGVDSDFVAWCLTSPAVLRTLQSYQRGIKNSLGLDDLRRLVFPLPPLPEQERIVEKVDQLMALCDELEAKQQKKRSTSVALNKACLQAVVASKEKKSFEKSWQRVQEHFEVLYDIPENVQELRQAILGLVVRGSLCFDETGPSDGGFEVPRGWDWQRVGDLATLVTSGSRGWKAFYSTCGATFIRSQDIKLDRLQFDNRAFVNLPNRAEGQRTRVERDDLLLTITGANVGKCAHVAEPPGEAYVSQHVALIRLRATQHAPWVHKWLVSAWGGRGILLEKQYGAKPGLNLDNIRSVWVPLPPVPEQSKLLERLARWMVMCDELETTLAMTTQCGQRLMAAIVDELVA